MIGRLAGLIRASEKISVLTGAGISTSAGIPDFRGQGTGLWEKTSALTKLLAFTSFGFWIAPGLFYRRGLGLLPAILGAEPTDAHRLLARLEGARKKVTVITQNIDGLHQKAGSSRVIELHGTITTAHCRRCLRSFRSDELIERLSEKKPPPRCGCGGVVKPDVVLFGDPMPIDELGEALYRAREADLFIVMGSSLRVYPAAGLPLSAVRGGARLVIINRDETPLDDAADIVVRGDLDETARALAAALFTDL
jgi:NAD-dependent deacetylase